MAVWSVVGSPASSRWMRMKGPGTGGAAASGVQTARQSRPASDRGSKRGAFVIGASRGGIRRCSPFRQCTRFRFCGLGRMLVEVSLLGGEPMTLELLLPPELELRLRQEAE